MTGADVDGAPDWPQLGTADPAAAKAFYQTVFGWQVDDDGGCRSGGFPVAAITRAGSAAWRIYLAAADPGETVARMAREGAEVLEAGDDQALLRDPAGATVGVRRAAPAAPRDLPGALGYATLTTKDPTTADAFYRAVFGYHQRPATGELGKAGAQVWELAGQDVCGRIVMGPGYPPGADPHWTAFFTVSDAAACAELVRSAGGQIVVPPFEAAQGRIAVALDPGGAPFCLLERPSAPSVAGAGPAGRGTVSGAAEEP